jgi:hypothetical protein
MIATETLVNEFYHVAFLGVKTLANNEKVFNVNMDREKLGNRCWKGERLEDRKGSVDNKVK